MSRARVQIQKSFEQGVDIVLEVRDARAPFSTCQYEVMNALSFRVSLFFSVFGCGSGSKENANIFEKNLNLMERNMWSGAGLCGSRADWVG